jgi:hypothetical protein
MTMVWLVVWLINHTHPLHRWNGWLVALLVCLAIDLLGIFEASD